MTSDGKTAVLIVGFRNASDVRECVAALAGSTEQNFDIFICENGGGPYFRDLADSFNRGEMFQPQNPPSNCFLVGARSGAEPGFIRLVSYRLRETAISLVIGEATENLGYAGAINIWLQRLLEQPAYTGFWILNPDTLVEPDAFSELIKYTKLSGKGMVGCRITLVDDPRRIQSRGLRWRPFLASTKAVDSRALVSERPDIEKVEKSLDAPSGASFYVTRECVEKVGVMDERYFLFFEDLDWGIRAKKTSGLGYAHDAVVRHHGGTTTGSAGSRSEGSRLTVFLEFRNRILFVRRRYPAWFPWTILILLLRALEYSFVGSFQNTKVAYRGIAAGLAGQIGRPDRLIEHHVTTLSNLKSNITSHLRH